MKRVFSSIIAALFLISVAWANPSVIGTTVRNIRNFSRAQAKDGIPVTVEATVTYCRPQVNDLFVQDGDQGIFIETTAKQTRSPVTAFALLAPLPGATPPTSGATTSPCWTWKAAKTSTRRL